MAQTKRKKRLYNIELPLIRKTTQLLAYDVKDLNNKYIKYDLTRALKGKSTIIKFKANIKDGVAEVIPIEIKLMPYYLRRMVRKGTNYVEDSFSTKCKNNQIRIKPFLVTRRKVSRAVRKALRDKARQELTTYAKTKDSETLFEEILKNKIQKELSLKLKKVYPLSLCEIKVLKVETTTKE